MSGCEGGRFPSRLIAAASILAVISSAAAASDFNTLGDGSDSNNGDLLWDTSSGCENCVSSPPHDQNEPFFDLDWELALRGAYVQATSGSYFEAQAIPSVTLTHDSLRGGFSIAADAEVTRSTFDGARIAAVRSALSGDYRFDATTTISGTLNLSATQESAKAPGTPPTIAVQPLVLSGDGEIEGSRQFGQFVLSGRADASRTIYGPTTLVDSSTVDNSHQNNWTAGGGLRLGYRVTPILTAFADGSVSHQWYDVVSPTYLVKLDATDYEARTGLAARWNEVFEAEASIGYGLRRFTEPALGEVGSLLYDASVTFRPDETVQAKGTFATTFGAPGPASGGTARIEYAATGELAYVVNPWLKLRGSAGASLARLVGTADTETSYDAGVGADYLLNEFATVTADYGFTRTQSSIDPPEDEHRITLGLTLSR